MTLCRTLDYSPPEMVSGDSYNKAVNVWSVGVLLYEFEVGKPPFEASTYEETYRRIIKCLIYLSTRCQSNARLPLQDLIQHDWIKIHIQARFVT